MDSPIDSKPDSKAGPETFDVARVAELARLALDPGELARIGEELGAILGYIGQLDALDTDAVEPTTHAVPLTMVYREDVVAEHLPREEALANAPEQDGEAFVVPKVV